jgi:hypothetical protein
MEKGTLVARRLMHVSQSCTKNKEASQRKNSGSAIMQTFVILFILCVAL